MSKIFDSINSLPGILRAHSNKILSRTNRNTSRVGVASVPGRKIPLEKVINCLSKQADELYVALNGYEEVPRFLEKYKNVRYQIQQNIGDRAKFQFLEDFRGYYFLCDDDINYPQNYVDYCISKIEFYKRRAVVGFHGSDLTDTFTDYYEKGSRKIYSFRSNQPNDRQVHILGTGIAAFHTDTLFPTMRDFPAENIADVYFALLAKKNKIPLIMIAHDRGSASPIEIQKDRSIYRDSIDNVNSVLNTRELATKLAKRILVE